jgi:hypothetical protein
MKTLLALFASLITANAQLVMDTTGGDLLSVGPGTAGWEFTTGSSLTLRSLGVYDWDATTPGLYSSHSVGLWDATTHALLASAVVPAQGAVSVGAFWYVALAAPLTLQAGHSYVLAASYLDSDFDMARGNVTSVVTDPRITMGDALLSTGVGFEFPDLNVSGANFGFYGANALEAVVPEPVHSALAFGIFLVIVAAFRKKEVMWT